ncbi:MAG: glycosyltransferase family protein [Gemmatimonadota bacterium]
MTSLDVAFIVQGEGRGHMTQALALGAHLRDAGHDVSRVMIGRSPYRSIPEYFRAGIGTEVEEFEAPTQVPDREGKALSVPRTVADAARRSGGFVQSMVRIAERTAHADVVVNFLDLMGGAARRLFPTGVPAVAVAHNHLFLHPVLAQAPGPDRIRRWVLRYARATAARTVKTLALSFDELPAYPPLDLQVVPPLLRPRPDVEVRDDGHLLAYALNPGYGVELAQWAARRPEVRVRCFLDGGAAALPAEFAAHLEIEDLDADRFMEALATCRGYVGSAGFESVCEAFRFGKPVLAIPTEGQFEQTLNAWDAERAGAATPGGYEDLDRFWDQLPVPSTSKVQAFERWVSRAPEVFVRAIEEAAA